jgi:Zn-finger nucleic acid-binding protein
MEVLVHMGVEIDQCGNCGGVWLDCDEWTRMTRGRGKDAVRLQVVNRTVADLPCPRCGMVLEMGSHSEETNFLIDFCPGCQGAFFDRGELARLLARNPKP